MSTQILASEHAFDVDWLDNSFWMLMACFMQDGGTLRNKASICCEAFVPFIYFQRFLR